MKKIILLIVYSAGLLFSAEPNFELFRDKTKLPSSEFLPDGETESTKPSDYIETDSYEIEKNFDNNQSIRIEVDENGTRRIIGTGVYADPVYKEDGNISHYQPRSSNLMELFKNHKANVNPSAIMPGLMNSEAAKNAATNKGETLTTEYIQSNYPDSIEANSTKASRDINEMLMNNLRRANKVQCFVKRQLVPAYKCPIAGFEDGATVGGNPNDSLSVSKKECDSFCESQSMGCRVAESGYEQHETQSQVVNFTMNGQNTKQSFEFSINERLKLGNIKYEISITYTELGAEMAKNNGIPIEMMMSVYRVPSGFSDNSFVSISENEPFRTRDQKIEIMQFNFDGSKQGKILFYPPRLRKIDEFKDVNASDVIDSITITGVDLSYTGNKYYFCGMSQIIQNPSVDCAGGKIYKVSGLDGNFMICKKSGIASGPEPLYGAFYSEESCNNACRVKMDCVETYTNYSSMTGNTKYNITVGCVDDPQNKSCTVQECERMFLEHKTPLNETVYDLYRGSKRTIISGMKVEGVIRPKVDIAAEYAASDSNDPDAYEGVFNEEMKDAAYNAMIKDGTYAYSKKVVSEPTDPENAVRIVDPPAAYTNDYTTLSNERQLYWKYKPSSDAVLSGTPYYIYKVLVVENVFVPSSGTFVEVDELGNETTTTEPSESFKDIVYLSMDMNGDYKPIYIDEYAYVFKNDVWAKNDMHHTERYVMYDESLDTLLLSSDSVMAPYGETKIYNGDVNYYEFHLTNNPQEIFDNTPGAVFQSQEIVEQASLPIKHYKQLDPQTKATPTNHKFYGVSSPTPLNNMELLALIDKKHMIYNALLGKKNKKEIYGDGHIRSDNVRIFVKGKPNNLRVDAELTPSIQEEDKEAILFMFMYED